MRKSNFYIFTFFFVRGNLVRQPQMNVSVDGKCKRGRINLSVVKSFFFWPFGCVVYDCECVALSVHC